MTSIVRGNGEDLKPVVHPSLKKNTNKIRFFLILISMN